MRSRWRRDPRCGYAIAAMALLETPCRADEPPCPPDFAVVLGRLDVETISQWAPAVWSADDAAYIVQREELLLGNGVTDRITLHRVHADGHTEELAPLSEGSRVEGLASGGWQNDRRLLSPQVWGDDDGVVALWSEDYPRRSGDLDTVRVVGARYEFRTGAVIHFPRIDALAEIVDLIGHRSELVAGILDANTEELSCVHSSDRGQSWTRSEPLGHAHPGRPPELVSCGSSLFCLFHSPEPSPAGPANLVRSRDGGMTWESIRTFTVDEIGFTWSLASDDSSLVVGWRSDPYTINVYASEDLGETWRGPLRFDHRYVPAPFEGTVGRGFDLQLVGGPRGTWHALTIGFSTVGSNGRPVRFVSTDGGRSWSDRADVLRCKPPTSFNPTFAGGLRVVECSVSARGDFYATWTDRVPNLGVDSRFAARVRPPAEDPSVGQGLAQPIGTPGRVSAGARARVRLVGVSAIDNDVFDAVGRHIAFWSLPPMGPGLEEVVWDARDLNGRRVSAGVYYWRIVDRARALATTIRVTLY